MFTEVNPTQARVIAAGGAWEDDRDGRRPGGGVYDGAIADRRRERLRIPDVLG